MKIYEQRNQGNAKVEALFAAYHECASAYRKQHHEIMKQRELSAFEQDLENDLAEIFRHLQDLSVHATAIEEAKYVSQ